MLFVFSPTAPPPLRDLDDCLPICVKRRQVNHENDDNLHRNPTVYGIGTLTSGSDLHPKTPVLPLHNQNRGYQSCHVSDDYGFDEYRDDIFRYKLGIEELHLPFQCLKNQPQVTKKINKIKLSFPPQLF